ncbi:MAG: tRNA lysidine(34) synthetase TilS [Candidatus Krumholzibacteriales bacterium]
MDCTVKIRNWINTRRLIRRGETVTAAVSGGPDSMALLTILQRLSPSMELNITAAHFNHMIRPEAAEEAGLVSRYCKELKVPLVTGSADVPAEAERSRTGMEEAARELRYSFLEDAAGRFAADSVALGHNLNDQAETVLHHIIRGSGIAGLAGIPPRRGIFIRPILCCSREEIESYVRENNIPFAVDRSNLDTGYLRNRIRNRLIPEIAASYNPSITESLARLAENLSELTDAAREDIEPLLDMKMKGGGLNIPLSRVEQLNDLQIYLLTDAVLRKYFGIHQDILKCHFDSVKSLVRESDSGREVTLPHGIRISREQLLLRFSLEDEAETEQPARFEIPSEGEYSLPGWGMKASVSRVSRPEAGSCRSTENQAYLADIEFPLIIRTRSEGDRITPFGMKGRKKLSDLMIDSKIPLHERDRMPVIEDPRGIVWVPGLASSERTRVTGESGKITRIRLEKEI